MCTKNVMRFVTRYNARLKREFAYNCFSSLREKKGMRKEYRCLHYLACVS